MAAKPAGNVPLLCLGLDAGSLKTACVALLDREVVYKYTAGPCNW
jgi:N-acetylglucosamine kinase-like BadF-type ATPase